MPNAKQKYTTQATQFFKEITSPVHSSERGLFAFEVGKDEAKRELRDAVLQRLQRLLIDAYSHGVEVGARLDAE